jgi:hypothetical protein
VGVLFFRWVCCCKDDDDSFGGAEIAAAKIVFTLKCTFFKSVKLSCILTVIDNFRFKMRIFLFFLLRLSDGNNLFLLCFFQFGNKLHSKARNRMNNLCYS